NGFTFFGAEASDTAGYSVSAAGDVNRDGFDDMIVGARGGDGAANGKLNTGDTYIVFGKPTWTATMDPTNLNGTTGFAIYGVDPGERAGKSVSGAGDVNGDGFDDLLISAYMADGTGNGAPDAGESYVVFGKSTWDPTFDLTTLNGTNGSTLIGI